MWQRPGFVTVRECDSRLSRENGTAKPGGRGDRGQQLSYTAIKGVENLGDMLYTINKPQTRENESALDHF